MLDSTIVCAHDCAAGIGKQNIQGLGRSSGGFTSKIHVKVDALGNTLDFVVTHWQKSDRTQAGYLLWDTFDYYILGDKSYDSDDFRVINQQSNQIKIVSDGDDSSNAKKDDKKNESDDCSICDYKIEQKGFLPCCYDKKICATCIEKMRKDILVGELKVNLEE